MTLSPTQKSHLIIHPCSLGAAGWSGAWGAVPIAGITPDTGGLIGICTLMGGLLAHNHGKKFGDLRFMAVGAATAQYVAGALAIKTTSSFVPIYGSIVNAGISLVTVQAIGWGFHLVLDSGRDLASLTREEFLEYLREGEALRQKFDRSEEFAWLEKMTASDRRRYRKLSRELARRSTSAERQAQILRELEELTRPYRPPGR